MILPPVVSTPAGERPLTSLSSPLPLAELVPAPAGGAAPWEVEIGFGKGRYLLRRAEAEPERRFLGIEVAAKYYRRVAERGRKRRLANLAVVRGEALALLSVALPRGFAEVVHVYFPDPWPKSRHHKRRLFDAETVDLVLGLLAPGGTLAFASDFVEYGEAVAELLEAHPALAVERLDAWPEGPRTNYEAKYVAEGRPIVRLVAAYRPRPDDAGSTLHPLGTRAILAAVDGVREEARTAG